MPPPKITVEQSTDAGETLLSVMRDNVQVFGVVAATDGTMNVGYWRTRTASGSSSTPSPRDRAA